MTEIRNTTTDELVEIECIIDGTDIIADVMGNSGVDHDGEHFAMAEDEIDWWTRWAAREERICDAYESADASTRKMYEQAICEYGYDMELLQDKQEQALGL